METYDTKPCHACGAPLTRFDGQLLRFCRSVPSSMGSVSLRNAHKGLRMCDRCADAAYSVLARKRQR